MGLRRQTDRQHYVISAVVFKCITCSTFDDVTDDVILPLGGSIFFRLEPVPYLSEYVCQIWLRSDGRVEKGGYTQTDRQMDTAALYSRRIDFVWQPG